ncbi:MAG: hypothetical protein PHR06_09445 [Candidatus Cloacimonetes bacterium]|nr:hypothetical protein [Candidatus Cloacimonadota bacterium]
MKKNINLLVIALVIAVMFLTACAPTPPPVSKDQLTQAREETIAAEKQASNTEKEKKDLENQIKTTKEDLRMLNELESEVNEGK